MDFELLKFIEENDSFLLLTHEKPDGDALGSIFGLFKILRDSGKKVDAYLPDQPPSRYQQFVPEGIVFGSLPPLDQYSNVICLDTSTPDRIGVEKEFRGRILSMPLVNIDHHPDNKLFGRKNIVVPEAAATAEIIFNIAVKQDGMRISQAAATCLMIGIVMDTGGFRFENTKASTLDVASKLISLGAEYSRIIISMFFSQPLKIVKLEADLVARHMKVEFSGKYAWAYVSDDLLKEHGVEKKDTESIIDSLRQIQGVEIAAVIYKKDDGFKISLRSKDRRYPVAKIARSLDGGGHELAAGCFIRTSDIAEAEKILLAKAGDLLGENG